MIKKTIFFISLFCLSCSGTGSTYQPIAIDENDKYYQDLKFCQDLSKKRQYLNGDTKTSALATAGTGGLIGAFAGNGLKGASIGALIGSGIGAGSQAFKTTEERKYIIAQCLRYKGHNIIM